MGWPTVPWMDLTRHFMSSVIVQYPELLVSVLVDSRSAGVCSSGTHPYSEQCCCHNLQDQQGAPLPVVPDSIGQE